MILSQKEQLAIKIPLSNSLYSLAIEKANASSLRSRTIVSKMNWSFVGKYRIIWPICHHFKFWNQWIMAAETRKEVLMRPIFRHIAVGYVRVLLASMLLRLPLPLVLPEAVPWLLVHWGLWSYRCTHDIPRHTNSSHQDQGASAKLAKSWSQELQYQNDDI